MDADAIKEHGMRGRRGKARLLKTRGGTRLGLKKEAPEPPSTCTCAYCDPRRGMVQCERDPWPASPHLLPTLHVTTPLHFPGLDYDNAAFTFPAAPIARSPPPRIIAAIAHRIDTTFWPPLVFANTCPTYPQAPSTRVGAYTSRDAYNGCLSLWGPKGTTGMVPALQDKSELRLQQRPQADMQREIAQRKVASQNRLVASLPDPRLIKGGGVKASTLPGIKISRLREKITTDQTADGYNHDYEEALDEEQEQEQEVWVRTNELSLIDLIRGGKAKRAKPKYRNHAGILEGRAGFINPLILPSPFSSETAYRPMLEPHPDDPEIVSVPSSSVAGDDEDPDGWLLV